MAVQAEFPVAVAKARYHAGAKYEGFVLVLLPDLKLFPPQTNGADVLISALMTAPARATPSAMYVPPHCLPAISRANAASSSASVAEPVPPAPPIRHVMRQVFPLPPAQWAFQYVHNPSKSALSF